LAAAAAAAGVVADSEAAVTEGV